MPAHCIRFWPAYAFLKACIDDKRYGSVKRASFTRLASPPAWNADFYKNSARSGGALVDLHIHDTDFVRHCFGDPKSVHSSGNLHHITTLYHYPDGPDHVVAEGGWDHTPGFPFRMAFTVIFDKATIDYDLSRENPLLICSDGNAIPHDVGQLTGYDEEVRHMLLCIATGASTTDVTIEDAHGTACLLDAERESLNLD
jgi:predicted dehydrogenase